MCVELPELNIVYMPTPKTACTSIKGALALVDPQPKLTAEQIAQDSMIVHTQYQTSRFRPHRWEKYDEGNWWRFTVVRDPLKRLLSAYSNRVSGMNELKNSRRLRKQSALPIDPNPDEFFSNLEGYIALSSTVKHHVLPAYLFIGPAPLRYDAVYRTSELDQLSKDLSERIGKPVDIPRSNSSAKALTLDDLQDETIDALKKRLAPEYIHLQDYYANPF